MSLESRGTTSIPKIDLARYVLHKDSLEERAEIDRKGLEIILRTTSYEYPPDFKQKILEAAHKGRFLIAHNHERNSDVPAGAIPAAKIATIVNEVSPENEQIKGYVEYFAASLELGSQGEMSTSYANVKPVIERLGVEPVPTPTDSDVRKGRITLAQKITGERKSIIRVVKAVTREQKSILFTPEATVKGGLINPETGKIYGMQPFVEGAIYINLRIAAMPTGYATFVPEGVSGGTNVLDSEHNKLTLRAKLVGGGIIPLKLMSVKVGEPRTFSIEEIEDLGPQVLDIYAGTEIAKLLKPHERGVYEKYVTTSP